MKTQMYHYTESGLPDVWIEGLRVRDDAGEPTILIPNINNLHKLIAFRIVISDGALTGAELRYLRTEMGMTQAELGELVHRERLTVSRWELGEHELDGAAEALIRVCALIKLDLDEVDPTEISDKCKLGVHRKAPIRIDGTDPENYRLAA
ncbi:MAG: helix-turn-helix transcriptional regulator [Gammaproteobacteria bacterium]|nr:helix-turn-helix transcriptional regulator [Gammaproteobacteria bacterium]MCY4283640.1 helix-turn-helix transcriptional regulator [Gammaproteobacteria bacterium]